MRADKHPSKYLQNSWNIYGEINFTFSILEVVPKEEDLIEREQYWIDKKKSDNRGFGFNLCSAKRRPGEWHQSSEAKMKLSGENSNLSKLTLNQVHEIIELLKDPLMRQEDIGKLYGVTDDNISAIKNGTSWGNIIDITNESKQFPLRAVSKTKETKLLGVYKSSSSNNSKTKYFVSIYDPQSKNKIHIGTYGDANVAANAYNHAVLTLHGKDAILNKIMIYVDQDDCNKAKLISARTVGSTKKRKKDSGFCGVVWNGRKGRAGRWVARFKEKQLGVSTDKYECAKLYNKEAIKIFGESYEQLNRYENGETIL